MGKRQSRMAHSKKAKIKGVVRKRRRHRAERRAATTSIREAVNEKRRAEGHPGWVESPSE